MVEADNAPKARAEAQTHRRGDMLEEEFMEGLDNEAREWAAYLPRSVWHFSTISPG